MGGLAKRDSRVFERINVGRELDDRPSGRNDNEFSLKN
jgi:hypothetical protein